jgi:hypothetical protein
VSWCQDAQEGAVRVPSMTVPGSGVPDACGPVAARRHQVSPAGLDAIGRPRTTRDRPTWMTVAGHPERRLSETRGDQQCPQR